MRVAIVENTRVTEAGQVGIALAEAGATPATFRAFGGEPLPDFDAFDALVVFGGEQNARDDEKHPYLPDLAQLMRRFGDSGKAVLGICLGSQLLARAYGGENLIGAAPEFGWRSIGRTEAGKADPVLSVMPDRFLSFQWHDDTFTLPPGALHLASNGAEALAVLEAGSFPLEAVITDLMMPVMDGWALINRLKERRPRLKIIAISGQLPQPEWMDKVRSLTDGFLVKPCSASDLLKVLHDTLAAPNG